MPSDGVLWGSIGSLPRTDLNWGVVQREPTSDLDRNAFLNLLMTQLRHQDPLNPMDDRDFMAQMAQFSSLEQIMQLNRTFEQSQAFTMIGRTVEYGFFSDIREEWVEGVGMVTGVVRRGDTIFLNIDGHDVPIAAVREVSSDFFVDAALIEIARNADRQRAQELVGRNVQALIPGVEQGSVVFIEGYVTGVRFGVNGESVLVVNNREIPLHAVTSVAPTYQLLGVEGFAHGGPNGVVTSVDIRRVDANTTRAYLVFSNGERVHINHLQLATSALGFVGEDVRLNAIAGRVESIAITGGVPFMNVRENPADPESPLRRINFVDYLISIGMATGTPSTPSTPDSGNSNGNGSTGTPEEPSDGDNE